MTTPEMLYAEFRRAEFLFSINQPAEAARVLAPVVDGAPEHTGALELYARALSASAQLGRAERALRTLVERRPDDGWARLALASTLERQSKDDDAAAQRRMAQALGSLPPAPSSPCPRTQPRSGTSATGQAPFPRRATVEEAHRPNSA